MSNGERPTLAASWREQETLWPKRKLDELRLERCTRVKDVCIHRYTQKYELSRDFRPLRAFGGQPYSWTRGLVDSRSEDSRVGMVLTDLAQPLTRISKCLRLHGKTPKTEDANQAHLKPKNRSLHSAHHRGITVVSSTQRISRKHVKITSKSKIHDQMPIMYITQRYTP